MSRFKYWNEEKRRLYEEILRLTARPVWNSSPEHAKKVRKLGAELFDGYKIRGVNVYSVENAEGKHIFSTDNIHELAHFLNVGANGLFNQFKREEGRIINSINIKGHWVTRERIEEE